MSFLLLRLRGLHIASSCFVANVFYRVDQLSKYSDDKRANNMQMVENLQSHIQTLERSLKMEKDKNIVLQYVL